MRVGMAHWRTTTMALTVWLRAPGCRGQPTGQGTPAYAVLHNLQHPFIHDETLKELLVAVCASGHDRRTNQQSKCAPIGGAVRCAAAMQRCGCREQQVWSGKCRRCARHVSGCTYRHHAANVTTTNPPTQYKGAQSPAQPAADQPVQWGRAEGPCVRRDSGLHRSWTGQHMDINRRAAAAAHWAAHTHRPLQAPTTN